MSAIGTLHHIETLAREAQAIASSLENENQGEAAQVLSSGWAEPHFPSGRQHQEASQAPFDLLATITTAIGTAVTALAVDVATLKLSFPGVV